jgi:hypothetical protein
LATKQSKIVEKVGKAGTKHEYEYNFREKRKKRSELEYVQWKEIERAKRFESVRHFFLLQQSKESGSN